MANVILRNEEIQHTADRIIEQYGVDKNDSAMKEAAYATAALQEEAIKNAEKRRIYR